MGAVGAVAAIAVLTKALPELADLGVPGLVTAFLGLAVAEITKFLNKKYKLGGKVLGAIKRS